MEIQWRNIWTHKDLAVEILIEIYLEIFFDIGDIKTILILLKSSKVRDTILRSNLEII